MNYKDCIWKYVFFIRYSKIKQIIYSKDLFSRVIAIINYKTKKAPIKSKL